MPGIQQYTPQLSDNDPQGFLLGNNIVGDFNTPTNNGSGYGAYSAAEKNQTYFAYFSSVGGTGPELIDQTSYFLKYLIDAQGNVVTPQPNSIDTLNMLQNFEPGKRVNVTSLEGTTLFSTLLGTKTITDVGRIETLLVTETSSIRTEFLPTMSFTQNNSFIQQVNNPPNYSFKALKSGNTTLTSTSTAVMPFESSSLNPLGDYKTTSYEYDFSTTTSTYGIEVKFKVGLAVQFVAFNTNSQTGGWNSNKMELEVVKSSDNFATSQSLLLTVLPNNPTGNPQPNYLYLNDTENVLSAFINSSDDLPQSNTRYITFETLPYTFTNNDKVRVQYRLFLSSADTTNILLYGAPSTSGGTFFSLSTNYSNDLQTTSSYWDGATFPTPGSRTTQWLTASIGLSGFINNNMVQVTPTASTAFGFDTIYSPANLQPGDYIRFEYDPSKQSRIYSVANLSDGRLLLEISPPIPTGSILNHFCIYRINPNAGNQIILNVKKPVGTTGQQLTGFLKPEYMSDDLEENFTTIIQKLAAEGLLT
jgi:hypothetical protein